MKKLQLLSNIFTNESFIPGEYSCEGNDLSPSLQWNNIPEGTKSFALTCVDPDAPRGDWIHWIAWNIPSDWESLPVNVLPDDQSQFKQGINSWGKSGYGGPCPPVGHGPHRYYFNLYALDTKLTIDATSELTDLMTAIDTHVLESSVLMGRYERK